MKSPLLGLILFVSVFFLGATVSRGASLVTAGYDVSVFATDHGGSVPLFKFLAENLDDAFVEAVVGSETGTLIGACNGCGSNSGSAEGEGTASVGALVVSASADAIADDNFEAKAHAFGRVTDTLQFQVRDDPSRSPINVLSVLKLDGKASAFGVRDPGMLMTNISSVRATVTPKQNFIATVGTAVTTGFAKFVDGTLTEKNPEEFILFEMQNVIVRTPVSLELFMEANASAKLQQQCTFNCDNISGTGSATADFLHTLRWGGILSVTDAFTGEPVEGWIVTSDSEFDYSSLFRYRSRQT